jgi:hypothetical protein
LADNSTSSKATTEQVKLVLTVVSTFGLGSILLVIIGRLWTIAYFEHFGLSAADLDFSIEDFAFRSLEVLISLVLAGVGVLLAWHAKAILRWAGFRFLLLEIAGVIAAMAIMRWLLELLIEYQPSLYITGILGIVSGVVLILMIFLVADIWFGPEKADEAGGGGEHRGTPNALLVWLRANWQKPVAAFIMLAIVFVYVPLVTQRLAKLQAEIDLEIGRLPAAFLESDEDLPVGVASGADPKKSVAVRVILTSGGNTYVLNSTTCKTIAEAAASIMLSEDGKFLRDENTEVCKVFAIPTDRLTSVEYIQVDGIAPSNDSFGRPEEVSLEDAFAKNVSTKGAERRLIHCNLEAYEQQLNLDDAAASSKAELPDANPSSTEVDSRKFKTLWYLFQPVTDGTLKVTSKVPPKNARVNHAVGIWEDQPDGPPKLLLGSHDGLACLSESAADTQGKGEREIAVIANVQQGTNYLVSLGSEKGVVDATLMLEFNPRARYFNRSPGAGGAAASEGVSSGEPAPEGESEPDDEPSSDAGSVEVLVEADRAAVTVQLTALNAKTFKEEPLSEDFELTLTAAAPEEDGPGEGMQGKPSERFGLVRDSDGAWTATNVSAGTWTLIIRHKNGKQFIGHVRVNVAKLETLVIALNDALGVDGELQRALFLLANAATEGFKGEPVSVDSESFVQTVLMSDSGEEPAAGESAQTEIQEIIEAAKLPEDFDVQIQIEGEEQALGKLADALAEEISQTGLQARVSDCQEDADVCFRIFRRAEALT